MIRYTSISICQSLDHFGACKTSISVRNSLGSVAAPTRSSPDLTPWSERPEEHIYTITPNSTLGMILVFRLPLSGRGPMAVLVAWWLASYSIFFVLHRTSKPSVLCALSKCSSRQTWENLQSSELAADELVQISKDTQASSLCSSTEVSCV